MTADSEKVERDEFLVLLEDEAATVQLGEDIAMILRPGDVLCLQGELGTGKTTLARAIIRKLAGNREIEVPSPTYTLCQIYDSIPPVSHFDFYRVGDIDEIRELGLDESTENGVVIIEWPERATELLPDGAVWISLNIGGEFCRKAVITVHENEGAGVQQNDTSTLLNRIKRSLAIRRFIEEEWSGNTKRSFLVGDASTRRYEVVSQNRERRILMDAAKQADGPPVREGLPYSQIAYLAEDVVPFIGIAETLREAGLATPEIHARRNDDGLLLIEHLGHEMIVSDKGEAIAARYLEAARLIAIMHKRQWPETISISDENGNRTEYRFNRYDRRAFGIEASLFVDWYIPEFSRSPPGADQIEEFHEIWHGLISLLDNSTLTLVLRDYHSPNIIWRDEEPFPRNIGLIDFQDAVIGPQAYDLASLAQDARVDVSPTLEARIMNVYLEMRSGDPEFDVTQFQRDYAILGAHRATKILGIFVRLNRRDGKPDYLKHLPRIRDYLYRNLSHPDLSGYREWLDSMVGSEDRSE